MLLLVRLISRTLAMVIQDLVGYAPFGQDNYGSKVCLMLDLRLEHS